MATPHPWEIAFDWDEFLDRWFRAVDARDTETLLRFSCVDLVSERVSDTRLQRSREGFVESLGPLWEAGEFRHVWAVVVENGPNVVVEWTRFDEEGTRPPTEGVSFFEIRQGIGMLELLRTYENDPPTLPDAREGPERPER